MHKLGSTTEAVVDEVKGEAIYSVNIRLKRVTIEYAYVIVPVTDDMIKPVSQGEGRIDVERVMRRAIQMGQSPGLAWYPESRVVEPHPIQKPQTLDRSVNGEDAGASSGDTSSEDAIRNSGSSEEGPTR
jgi:hypothetical protein